MRHRHLTHITLVMSLITVQRALVPTHRIQTEHKVLPRLLTCHLRSSDLKSPGHPNLRCLMCRRHESSDRLGAGGCLLLFLFFCLPLFLCVLIMLSLCALFCFLRFVFVVFCVFSGVRFCVSCLLIVFMLCFYLFFWFWSWSLFLAWIWTCSWSWSSSRS